MLKVPLAITEKRKNAGERGHLCPPGQERVNISRNVMSKLCNHPSGRRKNFLRIRNRKYHIFSGKPYPQHGGQLCSPIEITESHNVGALRTDLAKSGTHWGQN